MIMRYVDLYWLFGPEMHGSIEGRYVPWSLLVKDMPADKHHDLDFIISQLDWEKNVDTHFKEHNYLEPIVDKKASGDGYTDKWIVYGHVDSEQLLITVSGAEYG